MLKFIMGGGNREARNDVGGGGISCGTAAMVDHLDLQALPEGCIANVVSLTTPQDVCRLSSVSRSFRSASESDAVWDHFIPPDIPTILSSSQPVQSQPVSPSSSRSSSPSASKSKKELYLSLCDDPVLIEQGKMSFSLDKCSGKKCYMISARELYIVWSDTPQYWKWISVPESRFEEVAVLGSVCWLEIRGKIETRKLSPSTLYKAYLVFKSTEDGLHGFERLPAETAIGMVGGQGFSKRRVFLDAERGQNLRYQPGPGPRRTGIFHGRRILGLQQFLPPREMDEPQAQSPKERDDGWFEVELGEFFCEGGGGDGELEMTCLEVRGGHWKGGLIVQGIEIRPNRK